MSLKAKQYQPWKASKHKSHTYLEWAGPEGDVFWTEWGVVAWPEEKDVSISSLSLPYITSVSGRDVCYLGRREKNTEIVPIKCRKQNTESVIWKSVICMDLIVYFWYENLFKWVQFIQNTFHIYCHPSPLPLIHVFVFQDFSLPGKMWFKCWDISSEEGWWKFAIK